MTATEDEIAAVVDCYRRGWLTQGPRTRDLEAALGDRFGRRARVVGTATAALHLIFRALGIGPGDGVLTSSSVAPTVRAVATICRTTAVVVPDGAVATDLEEVVSARTAAVIVRRCAGDAPPDELRRFCEDRGLPLVEEVTDLLGRDPAVVGNLAYLSLASPSPLALGSGGAVLAEAEAQADLVASLRSHAMTSGTWERHHGREETYDVVDLGYNYRFDEPRAVLALARLATLGAPVETG